MNQTITVLPEGLTLDSVSTRLLKLPHPRTGTPSLYIPAIKGKGPVKPEAQDRLLQDDGQEAHILLEVQAVNATGDRPRTWFVGDDTVIGDGKLVLLTPFDPIFLLVRILLVVGQKNDAAPEANGPRRLLPYDDIFENASTAMTYASTSAASCTPLHGNKRSRDNEDVQDADSALLYEDLAIFSRLPNVQKAMQRICQCQEIAPDLSTYRLDAELLISELKEKITRLATEEAFKASPTLSRLLAKEGVGDGEGISPNVQLEARTKAALDLMAGYLPKQISDLLRTKYSFPNLAKYLADTSSSSVLSVDYLPGLGSTPSLSAASSSASVTSMSSSASSTFGMRRNSNNDGKGKKPDPKKKKPKVVESMGVKQLKKASTRGMSPLTSFFGKKTPTPSPNSETPP